VNAALRVLAPTFDLFVFSYVLHEVRLGWLREAHTIVSVTALPQVGSWWGCVSEIWAAAAPGALFLFKVGDTIVRLCVCVCACVCAEANRWQDPNERAEQQLLERIGGLVEGADYTWVCGDALLLLAPARPTASATALC
jgi:hypothetical protein